jgi:hypothetical protein
MRKALRRRYGRASGAYVVGPTGKIKPVKNLGWLIKHWGGVERFVVSPGIGHNDAHLTAIMRDGSQYETPFASAEVLKHWLHRPVFRGVDVDWFGEARKA